MQNKLTELLQGSLNKTAGKQNFARIHDNPKLTAIPKPKEPSEAELKKIVSEVVEYEIHDSADDQTKLSVHRLAACLDCAFPYNLKYTRHVLTTEINADTMKKRVAGWNNFSDRTKQKAIRMIPQIRADNKKELDLMGELLQRQQDRMGNWTDEQLEAIDQIQSQIGLFGNDTIRGQRYTYKGHKYTVIGAGKMKCPTTDQWLECIIYKTGSGRIYTRESDDFATKFKPIVEQSEPL